MKGRSTAVLGTGTLTGAAMVVLVLSGPLGSEPGVLSPPPLTDPAHWGAWVQERGAVAAVFALVRVGALAGGVYLTMTLLVGLVARALNLSRLVRLFDRVTLPCVRRLAAAILSTGMAAMQFGALPCGQHLPARVEAYADELQPSTGDQPPAPPATIVMRRLSGGEPAPARAPAPPTPLEPTAVAATGSAGASSTWTVQPGQCFWTIAAEVLRRERGVAPSDAEIVPYWLRLIEINRPSLADPGNADLVFPGQIFTTPTVD